MLLFGIGTLVTFFTGPQSVWMICIIGCVISIFGEKMLEKK
jgi:hypothetical protein